MQTIKAHFALPTETVIQLKFEQELDYMVNRRLAEQLVNEIMESKHFKPAMESLPPSIYDPYESLTRFYIMLRIDQVPINY